MGHFPILLTNANVQGGGRGTCALLELTDAYVYKSSLSHRLMKASRRDQNVTIRIKSDYIVSQTAKITITKKGTKKRNKKKNKKTNTKQKKQAKESSVFSLRETISQKWQNFAKLISTLYRQMPVNIQLVKKDSIAQNKSSSLKIKCRIARIEVNYSSGNLIY